MQLLYVQGRPVNAPTVKTHKIQVESAPWTCDSSQLKGEKRIGALYVNGFRNFLRGYVSTQ